MTCVVPTPSVQAEAISAEDPYRSMLREMIREGLSELRWGWKQSIAPAIRDELGADSDSLITPTLVQSIISEAERDGSWAPGWSDSQLTEARTVQRLRSPRSRHTYVARGEQAGSAKLTAHEVRAIRRKYSARYKRLALQAKTTISNLATEYKVKPMTIRRILHRTTWSHIP